MFLLDVIDRPDFPQTALADQPAMPFIIGIIVAVIIIGILIFKKR